MSIAKTKNEIQRDYERRSGYAAAKKYKASTLNISLSFHPENDADIIAALDKAQPLATQIKKLIRSALHAEKTKEK